MYYNPVVPADVAMERLTFELTANITLLTVRKITRTHVRHNIYTYVVIMVQPTKMLFTNHYVWIFLYRETTFYL